MIRAIKKTEVPECVKVIRESFLTVAKKFHFTAANAPRFGAFATNEERLYYQFEHENRPMYAYFENEKIVGYYSLAIQEDKKCELNNLCVLPEYRHRKIGEELLMNSFEKAKELSCTKMSIGIVEENTVLRNWYEKNGFLHTGTKKFDFFPFTCGYLEKSL